MTAYDGNQYGDARIAELGKRVARLPVLTLISRCYQLVNANIDSGMKPYWNIQTFQNMFTEIVLPENLPIPLVAYDEVQKVFFMVRVTKVDIHNIEFLDDENRDIYPTYQVTANISHQRQFIGDELHFYKQHEYREFHERIKQGWDMLRMLFPDGSLTVPFDRKISPFDICSVMNLVNITYRLMQFSIWFSGSFLADYPIEIMGTQVVNRYTLLSMDLMLSMSMQPFAYSCKLPNDPIGHFIYARPCVLWHDAPLLVEHASFIKQFAGSSDVDDARILTIHNMPTIYWNPITICDRH